MEVRSIRGDLLKEPEQWDGLPSPGEEVTSGPDVIRILDHPTRTEQRDDELAGMIDVVVVTGELLAPPPKWHEQLAKQIVRQVAA